MDKEALKEKIKKGGYHQDTLLAWIDCLPRAGAKIKPIANKPGDVYMHPVFGHPYIILKKIKDSWVCTLLTTEGTCPEILEECKSRFFAKSFITKALFTASTLEGSFLGVYDNNPQLNKIYKQLKEILG